MQTVEDYSRNLHILIVKRECVRQLSVDAEETKLAHCRLICHLTVEHVSHVKAAEVPDGVEHVVDWTPNPIIGHNSCNKSNHPNQHQQGAHSWLSLTWREIVVAFLNRGLLLCRRSRFFISSLSSGNLFAFLISSTSGTVGVIILLSLRWDRYQSEDKEEGQSKFRCLYCHWKRLILYYF